MVSRAGPVKSAVEKAFAVYEEWYRPYQPSLHEYQTRYALIDPILCALGWDISDPQGVLP